MMENNTKKYNAFISYRHCEKDIYVAKELQRKLEHFRLPANLKKRYPKELWRINRVFRDQDELAVADSLSEQIELALNDSDYLIAVCSPRFKESEWCNKEIATFEKIRGLDHILLVLAEGEPSEAFPEEVFTLEKKVVDSDGKEAIVEEMVEPLAADVRGEDKKSLDKMIDDAVIRLAAQMYGLGYDELKQRHREQKVRRIAGISAVCSVIFLVFGIICFMLFMKIKEQKHTIEEQHEKLQKQYYEAQEKHAESMAQESKLLMKDGRRKDAVYALRSSMPDSKDDTSVPYVASAEYELANILYEYELGRYVAAEVIPLPEDDFWGDFDAYRYFEAYIGQKLIGASELEDGRILLITTIGNFFIVNKERTMIDNYTNIWFSDPFENYFSAAVYVDGNIYVQFSKADYMLRYEMKEKDVEWAFTKSADEVRKETNRKILRANEEAFSGDGRYRIKVGMNHTLYIYSENEDVPLKTLYDVFGEIYGLEKLGGTDKYVLCLSGTYSYLLNENFEKIARIPGYYGYSEEDNKLILKKIEMDNEELHMYKVPLKTYDDIIKDADELLKDYKPSDEIMKRYGIR